MAQPFKPGDLVQLKSGDPTMTVKVVPPENFAGEYICECFGTGFIRQSHGFLPYSLIAADAMHAKGLA